ncbi:trehalose-phosphatase [Candidatus Steffania adelgidicola]|uniref:trehalose-phosphatase n=1 Tax=Candidatus Steffania adelgidicola TaxID=1076626 RepID=UPI001D01AEC9|nr:trehalose-phosphatase [Candidatus Steffania adelgidicola]UDG79547.1 Trehalose-6-phosphate phosphatase [Candidatus Steffania adelgidicola]
MTQNCSIPPILLTNTACFFDVDGTLAKIKMRPEWVMIPKDIKQALCTLSVITNGALALISGRPIVELDNLSAPLCGPVAGIHGAERRDAQGKLHYVILPMNIKTVLRQELKKSVSVFSGCHMEDKGEAFALHYRQGKNYHKQMLAIAEEQVKRYPELALQLGKYVVELKPASVNKGVAISNFMQETPFIGRIPLFIGDDLTDEAGFKEINRLQGITIKVGPGNTVARYHLNDVEHVHKWILSIAKQHKKHFIKTKHSVLEVV